MYKIYYHNDMDGEVSKYLVYYYLVTTKKVHPEDIVVFSMNHTPADEVKLSKAVAGDIVYIVDYSFTIKTVGLLLDLKQRCENVTWIDHHDTSIDVVMSNSADLKQIEYLISKNGSGALLTYQYCFSKHDIPFWIELVSDYDTWENRYPESTYFKLAYDTAMHKDPFIHNLLMNSEEYLSCIEIGKTIKKYIDVDNAQYLEEFGYESKLPDGTPVYVVNKSSNSWIFGDKYKEYDAVIVYAFNGEFYKYSMFSSNPDFDCKKIALEYGGGGHKGAAGWRSEELMFKKVNK